MRFSQTVGIASVVALGLCAAGSGWAQARQHPAKPHEPKQSHPQPNHPGKQQNAAKSQNQEKAANNGPRQVEEFMRMSPAEREQELAKLPPQRRDRVRARLDEFDRMPPAQKQRLQQQMERLSQLPPERQQEVRQSMRAFSEQPQDRRQAMRRQLTQVRAMTPEERQTYFNSPEFKNQYSPQEQGIMKNMTEILPPD